MWTTNMQLDFDLEFENMKFGQETLKQMTHSSKSTNLFLYTNNFLTPMAIVKKLKVSK
jgi:hypothetical protein